MSRAPVIGKNRIRKSTDAPTKTARVGFDVAKPMFALSVAIFIGAFLLFQIQPLIARVLLPRFGGGAAIWTTCMLFFQIVLLAGYAYAHATVRHLSPRKQVLLHLALLAIALAFLPVVPGARWKLNPAENPTWQILLLLSVCVGIPFFVLSATAPLLQAWFARLQPGVSPYRLYALSNAGSLLALVSYPFVFEPALKLKTQTNWWAFGFGFFVLLCGMCAWRLWRVNPVGEPQPSRVVSSAADSAPTVFNRWLWLLLPMCGSILLLGTTNELCQNVAVVPFLWVLPLSLYVLTFIVSFERPIWYRRKIFTLLLVVAFGLICYTFFQRDPPLLSQILIFCGGLFVGCMVCHGETYRLKPPPQNLTAFYLMIAAGGALGGVFAAVVAPQIFRSYAELNWGLCLLGVLITAIHLREKTPWPIRGWSLPLWSVVAAGTLAVAIIPIVQTKRNAFDTVSMSRNFHGVLRVEEVSKNNPADHGFKLQHGSILHGAQFADPAKARIPLAYYDENSGVGLALKYFPRQTNRRIGVVGLGVGTLATYGKPGDTIRFYEINPEVQRLAEKWFTYLKNSEARVEVALGDGRLLLESEPEQNFDLLVLDAFSGDATPVHLLTWEAFETYFRHLKFDGVVAVHISNQHVNLLPVAVGVAKQFRLAIAWIPTKDDPSAKGIYGSQWVLLSRVGDFLTSQTILSHAREVPISDSPRHIMSWTDDYTSLLPLLR